MTIELQTSHNRHLSSNLRSKEMTKPSLKADPGDARNRKLEKACQDFESIFVAHMMKTMRSSNLGEGGLFGNSDMGGDMFQDLFESEVAQQLSRSGGMGLAQQLYRNLAKHVSEMEGSQQLSRPNIGQPPSLSGQGSGFARARIQAFDEMIHNACRQYEVEPALVSAVIERESSGDPGLVSSKGAKGLMQLMDATAGELGVKNSFDPEENILGGTRYLREMLDRFDGDISLALAAYNAGPGTVERYQGIPPYKETQNYVRRVLDSYSEYSQTR